MATVCYFGHGSCFSICLNFASTHCLSPKKSIFIKPQGSALMWPPLVNPLDRLVPACFSLCGMCTLTHMPVVRVSVHSPGLPVFCQLTATTQQIASGCHTMNASRPFGSYTALPCILSATEPCLFSFPVCLVYREMIPVLIGNTGIEWTSAAGSSYPGVSIMPIYSPCCF